MVRGSYNVAVDEGGGNVVVGGTRNKVGGYFTVVSGGQRNVATGDLSKVCGGSLNNANRVAAVVTGGWENKGAGRGNVAAG